MSKWTALARDFKKSILEDNHYVVDIVEAACQQRQRIEGHMSKHSMTEDQAFEYECIPPHRRHIFLYALRRDRAREAESTA